MRERQKRRRAYAKLVAQATGRTWQTGSQHRRTVQLNRRPAGVGYRLPDTGYLADSEERGLAFDKRAARQSALWQPVKHVDTPVPPVGTFRLRDI